MEFSPPPYKNCLPAPSRGNTISEPEIIPKGGIVNKQRGDTLRGRSGGGFHRVSWDASVEDRGIDGEIRTMNIDTQEINPEGHEISSGNYSMTEGPNFSFMSFSWVGKIDSTPLSAI